MSYYLLYCCFVLLRENEISFFTGHPVFRNCNANLYGVDQLSKKLTTVLVSKIKQELVRFTCVDVYSGALREVTEF